VSKKDLLDIVDTIKSNLESLKLGIRDYPYLAGYDYSKRRLEIESLILSADNSLNYLDNSIRRLKEVNGK
jgi:hypothetical protein